MAEPPMIDQSLEWAELRRLASLQADTGLRAMFAADPRRGQCFAYEHDGLRLDLSRQRLTEESLNGLLALARAAGLEAWRDKMFAGEKINSTEDRPVLHMALRAPAGNARFGEAGAAVWAELARMEKLVTDVKAAGFTHAIAIGIGGSDLGPRLAVDALHADADGDIALRFVSNVDGADLARAVEDLDPTTTLFIIASKTFTTQETMANAQSAKAWLQAGLRPGDDWRHHFAGVTASPKIAADFGIAPDRCLRFWDWVGGRYSLWSAIGLPIALSLGMENFRRMLAGAHSLDEHFRSAPLDRNLPALMALAGIWNINFLGLTSLAVLPYDQGLARLPAYLQQADMESNGKAVDRLGRGLSYATGPLVFGEPGTNGQHAFYQLLHQGPTVIPADFILPLASRYPTGQHHAMLTANCLAQAEALMRGLTEAEVREELAAAGMDAAKIDALAPHKVFPGNRPSSLITLPLLDPYRFGQLIALYEHKIFCQGIIWGINSFDQWGVELGKKLAQPILKELLEPNRALGHDSATDAAIALARNRLE